MTFFWLGVTFFIWVWVGVGECDLFLAECGWVWLSARFITAHNYSFYTTGVDNFGPLFVKSMFSSDSSTMHKIWVTLYTCASSRALLLDLVPSKSSSHFIKSFKRFVSRRGVPNNVISDGGSNFASVEIQEFMNELGVHWVTNMSLSPWHGGFLNTSLGVQRSYCGNC